jgi:hypothetical protein
MADGWSPCKVPRSPQHNRLTLPPRRSQQHCTRDLKTRDVGFVSRTRYWLRFLIAFFNISRKVERNLNKRLWNSPQLAAMQQSLQFCCSSVGIGYGVTTIQTSGKTHFSHLRQVRTGFEACAKPVMQFVFGGIWGGGYGYKGEGKN